MKIQLKQSFCTVTADLVFLPSDHSIGLYQLTHDFGQISTGQWGVTLWAQCGGDNAVGTAQIILSDPTYVLTYDPPTSQPGDPVQIGSALANAIGFPITWPALGAGVVQKIDFTFTLTPSPHS